MTDRPVRSFRDLIAWQKAMSLVTEIYRLTRNFPAEEMFGLVSQMRRAAVSIPSNIAEGHARASSGDFRQFLGHARGSLAELETQVQIARNLNYLTETQTNALSESATEVGKVLNGLLAALKNSSPRASLSTKKG
ncbi:MAG: four helix bundle protein [Desulfobacca sp.]|uniref:four helix bundle protein n=1 Tax=Desulfobacca sp. TaxID=2067990 RepID=UPI004049E910